MFSYSKDLHFDVVLPQLRAKNIRQVYQVGADALFRDAGVSADMLLARFQEPARMGRACAGDGVVVADTKLRELKKPLIALSTLHGDLDFNAPDGVGANIFCIVLSPESQGVVHLRLISRVVRLLKNNDIRSGLLSARDERQMRVVLGDSEQYMMAA